MAELAAYSGDPWVPKSKYFQIAEDHISHSWDKVVYPFIKECDFTAVVDLAAGHGRNSAMLAGLAKRIVVLDIQPGNVEKCRQRFANDERFSFAVNNGYDLQPVEDSSTTLVYCFDAMVHFDSDVVRAYLADTKRVLAAGGRGFFHHSNSLAGADWRVNAGGRNFMSKELFEHYAIKEGLLVEKQRVINWGGRPNSDCLTLVRAI